jgi:uncharacterized protein involved in type VI secretion and phage assembly
MSDGLLGLLRDSTLDRSGRIYGVVTAVVTNNQDPEQQGRVRLRYPWLAGEGEGESWWARVVAPMAGEGTGLMLIPNVDDEVLVAFDRGDLRFPYVLGSLWSRNRPPPETVDDENTKGTFRSRSGHIVRFDDSDGAEKIEVLDARGGVSVVIDSKESTITVSADNDVVVTSSDGKVTLSGQGIELVSGGGIALQASGEMNLTADGKAVLKGATVEIN